VRVRAELGKNTPVHVTLRVVNAVGRLRRHRAYHAIRRAGARARSSRTDIPVGPRF
jgi:hypothetical protein